MRTVAERMLTTMDVKLLMTDLERVTTKSFRVLREQRLSHRSHGLYITSRKNGLVTELA